MAPHRKQQRLLRVRAVMRPQLRRGECPPTRAHALRIDTGPLLRGGRGLGRGAARIALGALPRVVWHDLADAVVLGPEEGDPSVALPKLRCREVGAVVVDVGLVHRGQGDGSRRSAASEGRVGCTWRVEPT